MASPDLSTLTSSAQIFSSNYTLPQIRTIHKALHGQIDEKAGRLRTQVGGSYRELLGTADTIVRMRQDNDAVQDLMGKVGAQCGRAAVAAKVSGLDKFATKKLAQDEGFAVEKREVERETGGRKMAAGEAARLRLLDACELAVAKIMRGRADFPPKDGQEPRRNRLGDRLVLATRVLVLNRLLVNSFGDETPNDRVRNAVDNARRTLASTRLRVLRSIEKVLQRERTPGNSTDETTHATNDFDDDVLQALCAYALATSSGAGAVLHHFLRVRGEAVALAFKVEESERERCADDVLRGLTLYTRTLLDVQTLLPFRLPEALASLKAHTLLADESLRQLEGLRLDVYERWCGDEIRFFTPFIRHDDLDGKSQAREMLTSWAAKGTEVLINGLSKTLERMSEFKAIMELRTEVLQVWIRDGGRARGIEPSEMLDRLRGAFNARMLKVLDAKVAKLHLVGSEVAATVEGWKEGITNKSAGNLWDQDTFDMELTHGAPAFMQDVLSRLYGRNDAVSKAVMSYHSWRKVIDDVNAVVEQLRKQRWDNDIEEIEDEETIEARQQLLSREDPRTLHGRLNSTTEQAFTALDAQLAEMWKLRAGQANAGSLAGYFLRVLRDIRTGLPKLETVQRFGLAIVPELHRALAANVSLSPLEEFGSTTLAYTVVPGRTLWEGDPALPSQPTLGTFLFFKNLSDAMAEVGTDLWSPAAVRIVKELVGGTVRDMWLAKVESHLATESTADGSTEENGDEIAETENLGTEKRRDMLIQWLFDLCLVRCCLETPTLGEAFTSVEQKVSAGSGLDPAARQRINKVAQDYWKKTSLLFGLLAG